MEKKWDETWEGSYTTTYDNETKEQTTKTLSFKYNEDSKDCDGTFVEQLEGRMHIADFLGGGMEQ